MDAVTFPLRETPALLATQKGHVAALKLLIKAGCDVNVEDSQGWTPAHAAAREGHVAVLELLIKAGCDLNSANCSQLDLPDVQGDGDVSTTESMLSFIGSMQSVVVGRPLNVIGSIQRVVVGRPLNVAAKRGQFECVRTLTRAGAKMVEEGESVEEGDFANDGAQQMKKAPELLCLKFPKVHEFLRKVRLAGGWRAFVTEERRKLATLMALWKRRRLAGVGTSSQPPARSQSPETVCGESSAPCHGGLPSDVAALLRVFELPSALAVPILRIHMDLVL